MENINKYIDHTLLKADATSNEIEKLCLEAVQYSFYSVCVNPYYVLLAKKYLSNNSSNVKITSVIGFPLGANQTIIKVQEAELACDSGANEIDMVLNISAMKNKDYNYLKNEILEIKTVTKKHNAVLKVIIETCLLTCDEIIKACEIIEECKGDFVKTSTGFSLHGANVEDVKLIKKSLHNGTKIKASGGISDYETACDLIFAGADRLGTSKSVNIIKKVGKPTMSF